MKKIWLIGWKDLTITFRDAAALVLMLAAPFALTLGLGLVTGSLSTGGGSGLSSIPVILVNQDQGVLGNALVELFRSEDLSALVVPQVLEDAALARAQVDADRVAAAIVIPAGFTASIIPSQGTSAPAGTVTIELYTNPSRPTSSGIIKTLVEDFLTRVEIGRVGGEVVVKQLLKERLITPADAARIGAEVGARQAGASQSRIVLRGQTDSAPEEFNILAYMAPGMALLFLMFTVANGGRTLLLERVQGTLARLLISPTTAAQILGGKVCGIYLSGVAQMLILIGSTTLLFRLRWGDPLAVLVLVLAAVWGAVGWGMVITALVKTPGQSSALGSAVMLIFGILGGSFFNVDQMPDWFRIVNKITPNAWGIEGFTILASGGKVADLGGPVLGLLVMGADGVFMAIPSVAVVDFVRKHASLLPADAAVINLAKGFGPQGRTISEVLMEEFSFPVAAMKGPSFARELIQGSPTGFTIGCTQPGLWHAFEELFEPTPVYVDFSKDVRGVELLSILKNIYAIAVGIMDAQFNTANLRFLFLTRATAEMRELMLMCGGKKPTMFKYCGFGDFGLTALNDLSRNRTLGLLIGKGFFNEQISEKVLLEGKIAVNIFCEHLQRRGRLAEFPIIQGIYEIFNGTLDRGAFARKMLSK